MSDKEFTPNPIKIQGIYVLDRDYEKGGSDLLMSNAEFCNELRSRHLIEYNEWSVAALMSYYVDVFRWNVYREGLFGYLQRLYPFEEMLNVTQRGLSEMQLVGHLEIVTKIDSLASEIGYDAFVEWLDDTGSNKAMVEEVEKLEIQLTSVEEATPLVTASASWLSNHPKLHILNETQWQQKTTELAARVTDMDWRVSQKLANEPKDMKLIRALCKKANLKFVGLTSYTKVLVSNKKVLAQNIDTEEGQYVFYELNDIAYLRKSGSDVDLCVLSVADIIE